MRAGKTTIRASVRRGFTLIELLVVLSIIAILFTLTAGAVLRFTGVQQKNNTQNQLIKLATLIRDRWTIATSIAYKEPMSSTLSSWIDSNFGTSGNAPLRRVIYVKLRLRQEFPQTFDEALNNNIPAAFGTVPSELKPLSVYSQYLSNKSITGSASVSVVTGQAPFESAACLLMVLQRGSSGAGFSPEDLGVGSVVNFPLTPGSTTTVPALVDGWGAPLAFFRCPSGDPVLNPSGTGGQAGNANDLTDPQGLLCTPSWRSSPGWYSVAANATNFQTVIGYTLPTTVGNSFYLPPLIVSGGPDKQFGLDSVATPQVPASSTSPNPYDNLSTASPP
jgi:prepilin-type N-terminal cleavage/methylation domain-containing protein